MPRASTDFPDADPGALETAIYSFDFGPALAIGETILTASWSINTVIGGDTAVSSRLIGYPSQSGSVVSQRVGTLLQGVTYTLLATVTTSLGQILTLYAHISCKPVS